jgi:hypothetical protein
VLITQRSRLQSRPRYQEVQVRGLIATRRSGLLIFVAAWWQQDWAASDTHDRKESTDIGIAGHMSYLRCGVTWSGQDIVAWPVAEGGDYAGDGSQGGSAGSNPVGATPRSTSSRA